MFRATDNPKPCIARFFKKHPELFAGWQPTAPAAILYAYWGPNPLNPAKPSGHDSIHRQLAADHRPFVALVDASLPVKAEELADFAVIYLESHGYEMSPAQLQALRQYAGRGQVVLLDKDVAINGRPAIKLLGGKRVAIWDPKKPRPRSRPSLRFEAFKSLRFALYQQPDRLAVHAVNSNVCLLDPRKKVLEVETTPLGIPLPAGWTGAVATCFDPAAAPQPLPCTVTDGVARLTLPRLHVYKIVLLERR